MSGDNLQAMSSTHRHPYPWWKDDEGTYENQQTPIERTILQIHEGGAPDAF